MKAGQRRSHNRESCRENFLLPFGQYSGPCTRKNMRSLRRKRQSNDQADLCNYSKTDRSWWRSCYSRCQNHFANAFFNGNPRSPTRASAELPVVAHDPHGFIGPIGAVAKAQQAFWFVHHRGYLFRQLADPNTLARAYVIGRSNGHSLALGAVQERFYNIIHIQQVANLFAGSEVYRHIAP